MTQSVIFDPAVGWTVLAVLAAVAAAVVGLALWRGLAGWWLRALAALALLAALSGPSLQSEDRAALSDIVIAVVDDSASQRLSDRAAQSEAALAKLRAEIAALPDTELRVVRLGDGAGDEGTLLMTALAEAMAGEPRDRIAGAVLISDGRLHDIARAPDLPAPLHLLRTGRDTDWDRRLEITTAPAFAILGEEVALRLRIDDQGAVPDSETGRVSLEISVDGAEPQSFDVPTGEELELPVRLSHAGRNVIQFRVPGAEGELTDRNNAAVVQVNGVRDRLRVLLVSGEPYAGERTWRNLLKADGSVDLVHFTILRPPEKQDGVPVSELSLIAFPTRELFLEKIDEFDLIIFDRYQRRGILPALYLDNVRRYVEDGGAVLVAAILVNGILMIPDYETPHHGLWPILILGGVCAGMGHLLIVFATRLAPAARVAPTQYSQIVWATIIGASFFGEYPDALSLAGMTLVAVSGLFTFVREKEVADWPDRVPLIRNR